MGNTSMIFVLAVLVAAVAQAAYLAPGTTMEKDSQTVRAVFAVPNGQGFVNDAMKRQFNITTIVKPVADQAILFTSQLLNAAMNTIASTLEAVRVVLQGKPFPVNSTMPGSPAIFLKTIPNIETQITEPHTQ